MENVSIDIEKPSDIKKENHRSLGTRLGSVGMEVRASEFMRYIVVYMAISLLSLAYHCVGVYFFSPPKNKRYD